MLMRIIEQSRCHELRHMNSQLPYRLGSSGDLLVKLRESCPLLAGWEIVVPTFAEYSTKLEWVHTSASSLSIYRH
jgi:hypothetical protein